MQVIAPVTVARAVTTGAGRFRLNPVSGRAAPSRQVPSAILECPGQLAS